MARISSSYGPRNLFGRTFHRGIDYAVPIGTPIYANKPMTITKATYQKGYGNVVYAKDSAGVEYIFGHLDTIPDNIKPGVTVSPGEKIANSGNTGDSTGAHLHYEVRKNGGSVNPLVNKDADPNSPTYGLTYENAASFDTNGTSLSGSKPTKDTGTKPGAPGGSSTINKDGQTVNKDTTTDKGTAAPATGDTSAASSLTTADALINPLLKLGNDYR